MLNRLFRSRRHDRAAHALYSSIIAQARRPEFYRTGGVADTIDGRFDLLALHVFLVLNRLRGDNGPPAELAQTLFDLMFADMDHNLRELGVGDMSVGRKVKTMAKALYGRIAAYDAGLLDPAQLPDALARNLYRGAAVEEAALARVASYVTGAAADLKRQTTEALLGGQVSFPAPVMS